MSGLFFTFRFPALSCYRWLLYCLFFRSSFHNEQDRILAGCLTPRKEKSWDIGSLSIPDWQFSRKALSLRALRESYRPSVIVSEGESIGIDEFGIPSPYHSQHNYTRSVYENVRRAEKLKTQKKNWAYPFQLKVRRWVIERTLSMVAQLHISPGSWVSSSERGKIGVMRGYVVLEVTFVYHRPQISPSAGWSVYLIEPWREISH